MSAVSGQLTVHKYILYGRNTWPRLVLSVDNSDVDLDSESNSDLDLDLDSDSDTWQPKYVRPGVAVSLDCVWWRGGRHLPLVALNLFFHKVVVSN